MGRREREKEDEAPDKAEEVGEAGDDGPSSTDGKEEKEKVDGGGRDESYHVEKKDEEEVDKEPGTETDSETEEGGSR